MADFLAQWLARATVMIPAVVITAGVAWWILSAMGVVKRGVPLNGGDMRTWPFYFAMGDATAFAVVFSAIAAWMGDSPAAAGLAAGIAAIVALVVARLAGPDPGAE